MRNGTQAGGRAGRRAGVTLVEIMIGMVIVAVIVLGAASFMSLGGSELARDRTRRAALAAAIDRLERMRLAAYADIAPAGEDYDLHYLSLSGTNWVMTGSDPGETVSLYGRAAPIRTTVQYIDVDGGAVPYGALLARVAVGFDAVDPSRVVDLETVVAP